MGNIRIGRWATARFVGTALIVAASVAIVLVAFVVSALSAFAQTPDDPASAPIPTIEPFTSAESIVVQVVFNTPTDVEFALGTVSQAPPPALLDGPPLIKVEVFDVQGSLIQEFNEWHPLWIEAIDQSGDLEMIVEESGEGRFVIPFSADIGDVRITDLEMDQELISIDARQVVLDYCAATPSDAGCAAIPGPGQLPSAGGAGAESGSGSAVVMGVVASALVAMGVGWVAYAGYQRRRSL
jgi:hypothetical protein